MNGRARPNSIASAKATLAEELRKLEEQEAKLIEDEATNAIWEISSMLRRYWQHLTSSRRPISLTTMVVLLMNWIVLRGPLAPARVKR